MGKKNRKKTTWRRLSLAGEDGGSTNEDQDRSDSQHSDESSDHRHYQRYPTPSTNGSRQPFYPHRSRGYAGGHNRYSRASKVPYSNDPSAPFPQAPKLTDGEPEIQDENYWPDEQFNYYNPYFAQFATPTLVLAAPPYHPLQWQEDPRLPPDCQYYFCLTQPVPQPYLPPTSPPSTTDSADNEVDGSDQATSPEQEEEAIPAEDYAYQTSQIPPQPAMTVPPPYVYPGAFMFRPYAYNTNNSYYWWNENGPGRGRRRKRRFIGGEGITYDRWPSRKDRSCDRLKFTTVQNYTDTSKPSVTSTSTINSTESTPQTNLSTSTREESAKMEPLMSDNSNSIASTEESLPSVHTIESPRHDASTELANDDKPVSNQTLEPVLSPNELLIRVVPERQQTEMDQERSTSKEQSEISIEPIDSKRMNEAALSEPQANNINKETEEEMHLEPSEFGIQKEAQCELTHNESCTSERVEIVTEANQREFETNQDDKEASPVHTTTNERTEIEERIAAVHGRTANSNPFTEDIERAWQSKSSTPKQISNPAIMQVSSQSWSKESGSPAYAPSPASSTPTDRQHYHQLEDPIKCSKYYQLCSEVEDMADVERVEYPESKPTVTTFGGEIVMHEAADSASECGSEDVEMLGHRYETAAEKLYKNNTLSLAVEMLSTNQQLPYDKEFKPIMEGGITNPCYTNKQVLEGYYGQLKRQASNGRRKNGIRKEVADSGIHTDESGDEGERRNTIPEDDEVLFSRNQVGANAFRYQPFGRRPRPEHSPLLYLRSKGPWQGCCCTLM